MAAPKKSKAAAKKKPAAKRAAVKAPAAKKAAAKQAAPKKAAAKKTASKKAAAKQIAPVAPKKTAAKKTAAKKTASKKAATKAAATPTIPRPMQAVPPKPTPKPRKKNNSPLSPLLSNEVPEQVEVPKPRGISKDGVSYTKDFDVKFLKSQRDELLARRAGELTRATRLEDEATSIIEDGEMGDVQFDDEGGEGDTMVVQRDLDRLLSGQARQTIGDIDEALARIEVGTYGYSVVSGKPIPRERLEAIPETTVLAVEKVSGAGFR
jgi:RNA polymerase-binding transcription factor DksA